MKKVFVFLSVLVLATTLFTSCDNLLGDNEGTTQHGFMNFENEIVYANTPKSFISFVALGNWTISKRGGDDWCTLDLMKGKGSYWYYIKTSCQPNTTGKYRGTEYELRDIDDTDIYARFSLYQYATRGDGSIGGSPLLQKVTGSDSCEMTFEYDNNDCVTRFVATKNGTTLHNLTITYASDSVIHVNNGYSTLKAKYDLGFQMAESKLCAPSDTFSVSLQYDTYAFTAFTLMDKRANGQYVGQSMMFHEQKFTGDNEHCADSLKWQRKDGEGKVTTWKMALKHSDNDNRYQSIDVNQLLLGVENLSPYNLLCFFRHSRDSKIVSEASTTEGKYIVNSTVNRDKSVKQLDVTSPDGTSVTYTFTYFED